MKEPLDSVIVTESLTKVYSRGDLKVTALDNISLTMDRGSYVAIMGPSGSGKSTLMNILGCLDSPTSGIYRLAGQDVSRLDEVALARVRNRHLGFVFQSFNLLPRQTALENVQLPMIYAGVPLKERKSRATEALTRLGLSHRINHLPTELSGGQQQRVAVARALVSNPELILADEPTGNLDSKSGDDLMNLFDELNASGITIVLVTHEESIARRSKRILRFFDGKMISDEWLVIDKK